MVNEPVCGQEIRGPPRGYKSRERQGPLDSSACGRVMVSASANTTDRTRPMPRTGATLPLRHVVFEGGEDDSPKGQQSKSAARRSQRCCASTAAWDFRGLFASSALVESSLIALHHTSPAHIVSHPIPPTPPSKLPVVSCDHYRSTKGRLVLVSCLIVQLVTTTTTTTTTANLANTFPISLRISFALLRLTPLHQPFYLYLASSPRHTKH